MVGCLPSFAVFIRGRVEASRVQYYGNSGELPSNHQSQGQFSQRKSRARIESIVMEDMEPGRFSSDNGSKKSLVDGNNISTQGWRQKWQSGTPGGNQ